MKRVLVLGVASGALALGALVAAPSALACNGALIQDANGARCVETPGGVSVGTPPVGVGLGPGGLGVYTGPLFPGFTWQVPLA